MKQKRELKTQLSHFVGIPGLEPGMTGPESVVLPLHHIPLTLQLISELRVQS